MPHVAGVLLASNELHQASVSVGVLCLSVQPSCVSSDFFFGHPLFLFIMASRVGKAGALAAAVVAPLAVWSSSSPTLCVYPVDLLMTDNLQACRRWRYDVCRSLLGPETCRGPLTDRQPPCPRSYCMELPGNPLLISESLPN